MNEVVADHFMLVECIHVSEVFKGRVSVGSQYFIDRYSIYVDHDGDAFGVVYRVEGAVQPIGTMYLNRFKSIR